MKKYNISWMTGGWPVVQHNQTIKANSELEAKVNFLLTMHGDYKITEFIPDKIEVDITLESYCYCGSELLRSGIRMVTTGSRHNGSEEDHYRDNCYSH